MSYCEAVFWGWMLDVEVVRFAAGRRAVVVRNRRAARMMVLRE